MDYEAPTDGDVLSPAEKLSDEEPLGPMPGVESPASDELRKEKNPNTE